MLDYIRKKRRSFIGIVVAGFCGLLMVGFGIGSFGGPEQAGPVAKIGDTEISYRSYLRRYEQLRARFRQQLGERFSVFEERLNLKQQAVDSLVNEVLLDGFIEEVGFTAGTRQIEQKVLSLPYFGGNFSPAAYQGFLRASGLTGEQLEAQMRKEIVQDQLVQLFSDMSAATDEELKALFREQNTEVKAKYLAIKSADFEEKVDLSDEQPIEDFYEENIEEYRKEKQVQFRFTEFSPKSYLDRVDVTDDDLLALHEEDQSKFYEPKKIQLRQILFSVAEEKKDEENLADFLGAEEQQDQQVSKISEKGLKRDRARTVLEELKAGSDFTELVAKHSEDQTTKAAGGDLGTMPYSSLSPEFRSALAGLETGDHSEIVETKDGLHILFVEQIIPREKKPFEEVRAQLEQQMRKTDAPLYAFAEAENFLAEWSNSGESLADYGKQKELDVKATEKLFGKNDTDPDIPFGLVRKIIDSEEGEQRVVDVNNVPYVVEVTEARPSFLPEFAQVREEVIKDYKKSEGENLAKAFAESLLADVQQGSTIETFTSTADAKELTVEVSSGITRKNPYGDGPVPNNIFVSTDLREAALLLSEQNPLGKEVYNIGNTFYLIALESRTLPEMSAFEDQVSSMRDSAEVAAGTRVFETLVSTLRADADVWVNPDIS